MCRIMKVDNSSAVYKIIVLVFACALVTMVLVLEYNQQYSHVLIRGTNGVVADPSSRDSEPTQTNVAMVYTGRWMFLRVLLPYLHRDLRINGGVIDEVWFMIVKCDEDTMKPLTKFTNTANEILNKTVFSIHTNNRDRHGKIPDIIFPYFEILPRITSDQSINFVKLDDDIVYIHPEAFSNALRAKNDPKCLLYFFNIAGSHWRLNWIYQSELGVYKDRRLNPKNLTFGYDPHAQCGWISPDCNEMALRTFLYHYKKSTLDKLLFDDVKYLDDKKQFSINAMLFNHEMIDLSALIKSKPLSKSDEPWWTVHYTQNSKRVNCIIGNALVVHFSYYKTFNYLLEKTQLLEDFVGIVRNSREQFKMDQALWKLLEI